MPITPLFALFQTDTHVTVEIRVPHIRVSRESLQVELSDDNSVLHFASLPIYTLRLDFAPYQFQPYEYHHGGEDNDDDDGRIHDLQDDNDLCNDIDSQRNDGGAPNSSQLSRVTFHPLLQDGTVRIELAKRVAGVHWPDLDLIGKFLVSPSSFLAIRDRSSSLHSTRPATSHWLHQVLSDDNDANDNADDRGEEDCCGDDVSQQWQPSSSVKVPVLDEAERGLYGFGRMFWGVFSDFNRDGLAKEMLEGPWTNEEDSGHLAETLDLCDVGTITESSRPLSLATTRSRVYAQRRKDRLRFENEAFNVDRYLADLQLDDYLPTRHGEGHVDDREGDALYANAMTMRPHWVTTTPNDSQDAFFTTAERFTLMSIPYPILSASIPRFMGASPSWDIESSVQSELLYWKHQCLCVGLLDILFAYVYDHLLNDGEATVESAWTISKLSAGLSWLDDWLEDDDENDRTGREGECPTQCDPSDHQQKALALTRQVVVSSTRRALIFPYIRTVRLAKHVWHQVALLLRLEESVRMVIRCLLQIRYILQSSDVHYLGNKLFIDPYLAWLQHRQARSDTDINLESSTHQVDLFVVLAGGIDAIIGTMDDTEESLQAFKDSLGLDLLKIESIARSETESGTSDEDVDEDESQTDSDVSSAADDDPLIANRVEDAANLVDDEELSKELLDLCIGDELFTDSNGIDPARTKLVSCDGSLQTRDNKHRPLIQEMD
jgi:SHQ1 protein